MNQVSGWTRPWKQVERQSDQRRGQGPNCTAAVSEQQQRRRARHPPSCPVHAGCPGRCAWALRRRPLRVGAGRGGAGGDGMGWPAPRAPARANKQGGVAAAGRVGAGRAASASRACLHPLPPPPGRGPAARCAAAGRRWRGGCAPPAGPAAWPRGAPPLHGRCGQEGGGSEVFAARAVAQACRMWGGEWTVWCGDRGARRPHSSLCSRMMVRADAADTASRSRTK